MRFSLDHLVYWSEPDGHAWEILTVSDARQAPSSPTPHTGAPTEN